jgi:hypothetical protein
MTMTSAQAAAVTLSLNAYQLDAIDPLVTALTALQEAAAAAQAAIAGVSGTESASFVSNVTANAQAYQQQGQQLIARLSPPATAAAVSVSVPYQTATPIDLTSQVSNATGIQVTFAPAHGTVTVAGMVVTYTPAAGFSGADTFSYIATGTGPAGPAAAVSITVSAAPQGA